tara:strand:- start:268 stop:771 length:504 start_codon:yes stop_codon:yes gene_type:complete
MTSILKVSEIQPTTTGNLIQLPTVPFVHIYGASTQTGVANATTTVAVIDTVFVDTHGLADVANNRIKIPTGLAGYYWIKAGSRQDWISTRDMLTIGIGPDSQPFEWFTEINANSNENYRYPTLHCDGVRYLNEGDTVIAKIYQTSTATKTYYGGQSSRFIMAYRIGG